MHSFRIEDLDDSEIALVSWDIAECDPRVERVDYVDIIDGRVFAEYPRWEALERVDACDVRSCRRCCAVPGCCDCCTHCGAPPSTDCDCHALRARSDTYDRDIDRAVAVGW
ncbi:MAG: hypothetical protein ACXVEF_42435 [Polyangiales bacterium]